MNDRGSDSDNEPKILFERQRTLMDYFAPEPPRGISYAVSSDSGGSASEENSDWLISDHDDSTEEQDLEVWLITYICTWCTCLNLYFSSFLWQAVTSEF